jgi:DNA repair exonuclease SbcCD ATPase subunit
MGESEEERIDSYEELVDKKTQIEYERKENDRQKKQWEKNERDREELMKREVEYRQCLKKKEEMQMETRLLEREWESLEQQKQEWIERRQQWEEKEKEKKKWERMIECVDRNAIPAFLLEKNLEWVERRLNLMLSSFIDKRVVFRMEDKEILFGLECHDEQGKPICSSFMGGMEGFIVDVCLKLCLSHSACYPCCNLFFIDEGISVFDQEHLHNIQILFDFLTQIRSHVFLISHLPSIQDFVDMSIEISRSNNKSRILFS